MQVATGREKLEFMKQIIELRNQAKPLRAPNGKHSNLNAMQHAQVRTPEFKAWFGDFEQANQPPVKIIELTGDEIQGLTPNEARKDAKNFVKKLIANLIAETGVDSVQNHRTKFDINLKKKVLFMDLNIMAIKM